MRRVAVATVLFIALGSAHAAHGCKLAGNVTARMPEAGATRVPPNAIVTFRLGGDVPGATRAPGEQIGLVPLDDATFQGVRAFRTVTPLPAGEVITLSDGRTFTVATAGAETGVPTLEVVDVERAETSHDGACGGGGCDGTVVTITIRSHDDAPPLFDLRIVQADEAPLTTTAFAAAEPVADAGGRPQVKLLVGRLVSGDESIVLVPRDRAGNSGAALAPIPFVAPDGGCAVGGEPIPVGLALLALALVMARRRTRRAEASATSPAPSRGSRSAPARGVARRGGP